ncbi:hypothetical protein [Streptomyces sp. KL116D]
MIVPGAYAEHWEDARAGLLLAPGDAAGISRMVAWLAGQEPADRDGRVA